jgi:type 1 glutamine amidotransferase
MRHAALALALSVSLLAPSCPPAAGAEPDAAAEPIKALLVIGGCCHDYQNQGKLITEGISARANVKWTVSFDPRGDTTSLNPIYENPDWAKGFDIVVHDECSADVKDLQIIDRILKPHRDGVPAVLLHCAMHSYRSEGFPDKDTPWFEFTGFVTTGHGPHEPLTVVYTDAEHPITRGLQGWTTGKEELYNNIRPLPPTAQALATGKQEGQKDAVTVWTNAYGPKKTKVFGTTLGHANEMVGDARYLDLITRGMLWSLGKLDDQHLKPAAKAEPTEPVRTQFASAATPAAKADEDCGCEGEKQAK